MGSLLLAVIYLIFISLGLPDSLLGSGWPEMQAAFGVPSSYAGYVSMTISCMTVISALVSPRLIKRIKTQWIVIVSIGLTVLGLIGFSFSSQYWMLFLWAVPYGLGWRTGLGFGYAYSSSSSVALSFADGEMPVAYNRMFRFAVPLEVNYLLGKGKSKFESGAGAIVCLDRFTSDTGGAPEHSFGAIPYLSLGYRLVTDNGFLLRAGAMPLLSFSPFHVSFYPYLGFGWAF